MSNAKYSYATGVAVRGYEASVDVGGNISTIAKGTYATGVFAYVRGNLNVHVGGDVYVYGYSGATGVYGNSTFGYDVTVNVGGSVVALTNYNEAFGVNVYGGNVRVTVGKNVDAEAVYGNATGVLAKADFGVGNVSVGGNVRAVSTNYNAYGVYVTGDITTSNIHVGGDITAIADKGKAYGIKEYDYHGATVYVGGNVKVHAYYGATGVYVTPSATPMSLSRAASPPFPPTAQPWASTPTPRATSLCKWAAMSTQRAITARRASMRRRPIQAPTRPWT